jgi:hypothetical protein
MKATTPGRHTRYLVAILNGCVAPRDGSQNWLRPATDRDVRSRPIVPSKRRCGRFADGGRGR